MNGRDGILKVGSGTATAIASCREVVYKITQAVERVEATYGSFPEPAGVVGGQVNRDATLKGIVGESDTALQTFLAGVEGDVEVAVEYEGYDGVVYTAKARITDVTITCTTNNGKPAEVDASCILYGVTEKAG